MSMSMSMPGTRAAPVLRVPGHLWPCYDTMRNEILYVSYHEIGYVHMFTMIFGHLLTCTISGIVMRLTTMDLHYYLEDHPTQ